MKAIQVIAVALVLLGAGVSRAGEKVVPQSPAWYEKQYPYMQYHGKVFSFESEFQWPAGFHRLDQSQLTPFQSWVSYLPLWDREKGVYSYTTGTILKRDQISRPVHFVWRTSHFSDCVIPLQLLADYKFWTNRPFDLAFVPNQGDTITYKKYLENEVYYDSWMNVKFKPSAKKKPSPEMFNKFFDQCALVTNYLSLEANCVPIADTSLRPGDVCMGRDSAGLTGRVYVVLVVATNDKGECRYIVGTGCAEPCDLFIPLFHEDRGNPWLTLDEIRELTKGHQVRGFFRLRYSGKK